MHPRVLIVFLAVSFAAPVLADARPSGAAPAPAAASPASNATEPVPAATTPAATPAAPSGAGHAPAPAKEGAAPKAPLPVPMVSTPARDISQLEWMRGCWSGEVNKRTFTEQWTAPAAGMMLGLGHTVLEGKTESFEFMRMTTDADGKIMFVLHPGAKEEDLYVFEGVKSEPDVDFFLFGNPRITFPSRIVYARAAKGQMFVHVQGKVNGADREVVYPFWPVDCRTGKRL
jgi:hypothetical protein